MNSTSQRRSYRRWVNLWRLRHPFDQERAMHQAVGGDFAAVGALERDLLKSCGLRENDYLIDVGCGSGRLAKPLASFLRGKYLGTDIVPSLVRYARDTVGRTDWSFKVVEGLAIPERDEVADFVCFFSVLTHTQQVESYRYLREAKRVLKPGGKVVFSFLEYGVPLHWDIFQRNTDKSRGVHPLNEFLSREMIEIWASHLGLRMETMRRGEEEFIPVTEPVVFESGQIMEHTASFGQSVCVLVK